MKDARLHIVKSDRKLTSQKLRERLPRRFQI